MRRPSPVGNGELAPVVRWTLRSGLLVSGLLLILGLARVLAHGEPAPAALHARLATIFESAMAGDGAAIIQLGLLALILTPVLRVCALLIGWTRARAPGLAGVALTVLALLLISMLIGLH